MDDFLALLDDASTTELTPEIISAPSVDLRIFDVFHKQIDDIEALVVLGFGRTLKTEKDNKDAVNVNRQVKAIIKAIEEERKRIKQPYHEVVKLIDSNVKGLRDKLEAVQEELEQKIKAYLEEQQKIAIERTAIIENNGNNENSVIPEIMPVVTVTDSGATAKLDTKMDWTITDFKQLPDELFKDRKEQIIKAIAPYINAKMKAGITEISGVSFTTTTILKTK